MSDQKQQLLSVKQFAEKAGISKQAVYNQLETRLKPYVVKVDNATKIDIAAFEKFYSSQVDSNFQSTFNQVEQAKGQPTAGSFDKVLEVLQQQLEVKDKQIADLHNRLSEMSDIIQQQQTLLDQQQKLNLIDKKDDIKEIAAVKEQGQGQQEEKSPIPQEEQEQQKPQEQEQTKKKGFWARLFGD